MPYPLDKVDQALSFYVLICLPGEWLHDSHGSRRIPLGRDEPIFVVDPEAVLCFLFCQSLQAAGSTVRLSSTSKVPPEPTLALESLKVG